MDHDYFQKIEPIFTEALKLHGTKRQAYIDRVCAGQPDLRAEMESLLETESATLNFFAAPVLEAIVADGVKSGADLARSVARTAPPALPGSRICRRGHTYDPLIYALCPRCGIVDPDIEVATQRPKPSPLPEKAGGEAGHSAIIAPVVGWLVCVEGAEQGRDFPLRSGRNTIGRSSSMNVCLGRDAAVLEVCHAVLTFDPANQVFKLLPGEVQGTTYLNGAVVQAPLKLTVHDTVQVGNSFLRFVPFCGDHLKWREI